MQLDDRLTSQNKKDTKKKINSYEEDEETLTYKVREPVRYINEDNGTFERFDHNSINTNRSVFDRTAVFRTDIGGDQDGI